IVSFMRSPGYYVWDVATGQLVSPVKNTKDLVVSKLAFSADGKSCLGAYGGDILLFPFDSPADFHRVWGCYNVTDMAIAPDNTWAIMAGGNNGSAWIISLPAGEQLKCLPWYVPYDAPPASSFDSNDSSGAPGSVPAPPPPDGMAPAPLAPGEEGSAPALPP